MTVSNTKLANTYNVLAKKLDIQLARGKQLGIRTGAQRIELICEQYDRIAPDIALALIDLDGLQAEVEEARLQSWPVQTMHLLRNIFSLAPLITTWFALFWAVKGYQENLQLHPADNTTPFLQQWQGGFHNTTWFTFTFAAALDVLLLISYLTSVLLVQWLERRAQKTAIRYIEKLSIDIDELIEVITQTSISPIQGPADVDKVVKAVTNVMDHAIKATDTLLQAARQAITDSQTQVTDMFQQQVIPLFSDFQNNSRTFDTNLGKFATDLQILNTSIKQLSNDTTTMEKHAQSYVTIGTEMNTHLADLRTTQGNLVGELSNISGNITGATGAVQTAASGMTNATDAVKVAATHLDNGLQVTVTKVTDSVDRATAFQGELSNFLTQLGALNTVTQNLTATSAHLAGQVKTMGAQVTALETTQQQVSQQLTAVVTHVASAANSMATATTRVEHVASSLNTVAQTLSGGLQYTVNQMTTNIDRSTKALGQVENSLAVLVPAMAQAASQFATYSPGAGGGGGGGVGYDGFFSWLMGRRRASRGTGGRTI